MLALQGEFDLAAREEFDEIATRTMLSPPQLLVVDLRALEFIASTGLHALAGLAAAAHYAGWEVSLVRGPARVQQAFRTVGLENRMHFIDGPLDLDSA